MKRKRVEPVRKEKCKQIIKGKQDILCTIIQNGKKIALCIIVTEEGRERESAKSKSRPHLDQPQPTPVLDQARVRARDRVQAAQDQVVRVAR